MEHEQATIKQVFERQADGLRITAEPIYLDDHSDPERNYYCWAYHIVIHNTGSEKIQVMNRYWRITDAAGRYQEVFGAGLVGARPVLEPGQAFSYSSGAALHTPSGFMTGSIELQIAGSDKRIRVDTPDFSLDSPTHTPILYN